MALDQCVVSATIYASDGTLMPDRKAGLQVLTIAMTDEFVEPVPNHATYYNDADGVITIPLPRLSNVTLKSISTAGKTTIDQFASAVTVAIPDAATANLEDLIDDPVLVITGLAPTIHAATSKTTPVNADEIPIADSAASFGLKKLTWANLKATIKAYTDTLYAAIGSGVWGAITGTLTAQTDLDAAITAAKARANHTGTQAVSTVSGLQTALDLKADGLAGVKVYRALLTQTGTDAPVATVLENSLGGTLVWTYSVAGRYDATLTGAFPVGKVGYNSGFISNEDAITHAFSILRIDNNSLRLVTTSTSDFTASEDNRLAETFVQVLVYP